MLAWCMVRAWAGMAPGAACMKWAVVEVAAIATNITAAVAQGAVIREYLYWVNRAQVHFWGRSWKPTVHDHTVICIGLHDEEKIAL